MTASTTRNNSQASAGHFGLKNLVALLRGEGHRTLSGVSAFTLTTSVLHQLNIECRRHSLVERGGADSSEIDRGEAENIEIERSVVEADKHHVVSAIRRDDREREGQITDHTEWHYHMQFVKDFMQFSPNLKLSCDSDVLTSPISLHRFSHLTSLNLQKVPVQRLQGLQLLRNSLTTIIVYKGLETVKDLLESCGGDLSTPLSWPQLKFVSLVFNSLTELDDSLRLMPHVQVLDLSHNLLQTCGQYLEYLVDLRQLSLAYNNLTQVPCLSATARASLTCLVMRGNNLDSLQGVEELTCLQQLDLGENCINKHKMLEPLSSLVHLTQLQVDGNPLSYHRLHRPLTASCLARQAANVKFELDQKKLTVSELAYFSHMKARLARPAAGYDVSKRGREARANLMSRDDDSGSIPSAAVPPQPDSREAQVSADPEAVNSRRKSRYKKGKPRDTRVVDIEDTYDSQDHHIVRPGSAPFPRHLEKLMTDRRQEAMTTRREIEELRKHYGHNWLQAIEDRGIFNKKPESALIAESTATPEAANNNTSPAVQGSYVGTRSAVRRGSRPEVGVSDHRSVVKEEPGRAEKSPAVDAEFTDQSKPLMSTIARLATGLPGGGVDRAATCASAGMRDPDVLMSVSATANVPDGGRTTLLGYRPLSAPLQGDQEHQSVQSPNRKSDPDSGDLGSSMFHDVGTKPHSNSETVPTCQAETFRHGQHRAVTKGSAVPARDTERDLHKADTNGSRGHTLGTNSSSDSELVDNYQAGTQEVVTHLAYTAQLPDVVPSRQEVPVQTQQTQVSATIWSGDDLPADKNTTPAYKSSRYVSIKPSKDGQTTESVTRRDSTADDPEMIEPMLVSCPLQHQEVILVTMTSRYLVEKNFRGKVTERLELTSLNYLDWKRLDTPPSKQTLARRPSANHGDGQMLRDKNRGRAGGGEGSIQLDLRFEYMRKDKQSRCYIMDLPDGNLLVSRLQPFMDLRDIRLKAAVRTVLQCLKCNQILPDSATDQLRNGGKSLQPAPDCTDLPDVGQACPRCGSTLIIQLASTGGTPGAHPPTGSHSQRLSASGPSGKNKMSIPLVKKVFNRITSQSKFRRKSNAEKVSTQVSSSSPPPSSSTAATVGTPRINSSRLGRDNTSTPPGPARDRPGRVDPDPAGDLSGRDRSSAFRAPANIARAMAEEDDTEDIGDGLVCVDDYFSADLDGPISSCQLAEITSSLRGDSPNRMRKAQVERASYSVSLHTEYMSRSLSDYESRSVMSHSYVDGARFEPDDVLHKHEHLSRPVTITGVVNNRGDPSKQRQRQKDVRQDTGGSSVARDIDTIPVPPERRGKLDRSGTDHLYISRHARNTAPVLAGSLGGQRTHVDSSTRRRQSHGLVQHSETSVISEASYTRRSDLPEHLRHPAVVCSSVPKSVSYLEGKDVPTEQFAIIVDDVSSVSRNLFHTSLSSDRSDQCELPESSVGTEIPRAPKESSRYVSGSQTSEGGAALVIAAARKRLSDEPQDDRASIYDFSDEPKHSHAVWDLTADSTVSNEDNVCQFEEIVGCPDSVTANLQDGVTPTNDCLPVGETLDTGHSPDTTEAATEAIGGEATVVEDESSDEDLVAGFGFHHLNHRLTLFLMMALFGTDEEFLCKIQCPIVQYIIAEPYQGMLVMSSQRFYVLKFTSENHRQPPDQWIQCVDIQPIPELRYIDVGLGGLSLRLEFVTDCSSFTLVSGNRDKTVQFVEALHGHLTRYATRHGMNSTVVVNEDTDQSTINNLDRDVLSQVTPGQKLLYYCMGLLEKGVGERYPVCVVVSSSEICLVRANYQWPQPRLQGPVTVETVGQQFTVLARQRINNVASLKVCPISSRKVSLELFAGADDQTSCWNITFPSRQITSDFIDAISGPWAQEFGVALDVTHHAELNF